MKYSVVGVRRNMSFETKDNGTMKGAKLFVTCADDRVEGMMTDSFFVPSTNDSYSKISDIGPDMNIDISFNRYGRIDSIAVV